MSGPRVVFRMAPWVIALILASALSLVWFAWYLFIYGDSFFLRVTSSAMAAFALAATLDALFSRLVLEPETLLVISLFRRRAFARSDFEGAKVDGGVVVLKRKDGAWLVLPNTGGKALAMRNSIDAWIKRDTRGQT
ncbi:MAG: hypothetical protein WC815_02370 [Vicinamibacterales bacterium]|jgi:hypothetical protein